MRKRWNAILACLALTAVALGASTAPALSCEEEGGGFVSVRVKATLAPEDAARIVFESYDGTLAIKGITLRGTATWTDGGATILEGPVNVIGVILTTGDQTTFLKNRGILWLKYQFLDEAGAAVIGTGEGFVTLEEVGGEEGRGSFQGTVTLAGTAKQFSGTGETEVFGIPQVPAVAGGGDCDEEEGFGCDGAPGMHQEMDETVITGEKPGFEFESALTATQLDKLFQKAEKKLTRERDRRKKVIRAVR